jgi:FlaA1/EpsC-like NDP-sugar epimerase
MGATKYYAETIMRHFAKQKSQTSFAAVRFGNVLASNGSVIPLFKKQIEQGGPVTVTDKEITRFFMTIPEAVGLILQCGVLAKDGEIFILDMGQPVKIIDLAEKMIRQSGYIPYEEIQIEFTGLRPGEKMYEELLLDPKTTIKTNSEKIYIDKTELIQFNQKAFDMIVDRALMNSIDVIQILFEQLKLS